MSSKNVVISVQNLSKRFEIYEHPADRLKQFIFPRIQRLLGKPPKKYFREFWALNDISFNLKKGMTLGIVGSNGSGKSTLLQIVYGTLNPSFGKVSTFGRVGAILELGSGFNSNFTGRENIYMNAAVLGLNNEEIDRKIDNILTFADIGDFIDQPVMTYSSGMIVRLAFAVQTQIDPDILIIDEALAVGDAKFQAKCFNRLAELKAKGTSIILVTHSSEQVVTHCDHAILIDHGKEVCQGEPRDVINKYMDLLFGKEPIKLINENLFQEIRLKNDHNLKLSTSVDKFATRNGYNPNEYRWGDGSVKILDFYISADDEPYPSILKVGQKVKLIFSIKLLKDLINLVFGITIKTKDGITVYGTNSEKNKLISFKDVNKAGQTIIINVSFDCLLGPGDYFVSIGMSTLEGEQAIPHDRRYDSIHLQVGQDSNFFGITNLSCKLNFDHVNE